MQYIKAIFWLTVNFITAAVKSGVNTAYIILFKPNKLNSGLCEMAYSQLDGYQLVLLGMLITLTPGSTLIAIDREQKILTMHLLDLNLQEQTIAEINHHYIRHLAVWNQVNASNKAQEVAK